MHLSVLRNVVLLLGSSAVLQALTIPIANRDDGLALREELPEGSAEVVKIDGRSPKGGSGGRGGGGGAGGGGKKTTPPPASKTPPPPPPTTTTTPKTTPKTTTTSTTSTTSSSSSTTSTSTTSTSSSTSRSSSSSSATSVTPLPWTKAARPTQGFNYCNVDGFNCLNDAVSEAYYDEEEDSASNFTSPLNKRDGDSRDFKLKLKTGTLSSTEIEIQSKSYWSSSQLFDNTQNGGLSLTEAWYDFKTDDIKDYSVDLFTSKPKKTWSDGMEHKYVTEHIVELQSIMRFILAATGTKPKKDKNPVTLSQTTDAKFFIDFWLKDVDQNTITSRPNKFPGYSQSKQARSQDKSISNIIFEAMGSKRNAGEFVLCEEGINSFKAKLWGNSDPVEKGIWKKLAKDGASGAIPDNEHLEALRTTLAVFEYMNEKDVTSRMKKTIAFVKEELNLDNLEHLTGGTRPKDSKDAKKDYDMPAMWIEYMNKQLERFKTKGQAFIDLNVPIGVTVYEDALKQLAKAMKVHDDEDKIKDAKKKQDAVNDRVKKRNDLIKKGTDKLKAMNDAIAARKKAEKDFNDAVVAVSKVGNALKAAEKKTQDYDNKSTRFSNAKKAELKARKDWGLNEREVAKLDRTALEAVIKDLKDTVQQLKDYQTAGKKIAVPKAE